MKTPREILLARHRNAEPRLNQIRREVVDQLSSQPIPSPSMPARIGLTLWRELIWPCRRTWAMLAAAWMVLLAVHFSQTQPARMITANNTSSPARIRQAFQEQQRLLTELIDTPVLTSPAEPPPPRNPAPRSERRYLIKSIRHATC
ncbi:MAG TPA: hypothetical protein P5186_06965 [Candidatus Paceibacterota bacterium]|nr:hypothetical protein [Verrucomicrobiota bacterium]HRY47771.1 hypothetical protein [Candidatus Paceibacterota bacterium]HRZ99741.1 hypothetical protein [Candidatus Paceibacterota bacterium]